jgi:hypothetical protein
MRMMLTSTIAAGLVAATAGIAAAPGQVRPGELTRGEVWVQNKDAEAIPVRVLDVHADAPVRVRIVPNAWEYRTMILKVGSEYAAALAGAGNDGWETTGLSWPAADGTLVLLKRPR